MEENLKNVEQVLLRQYGVKAKKEKCVFLSKTVEYLGHRIDESGLHTLDSKVTAVTKAPRPKNVQELRSFLGLVHYYHKFMPNLATLLHPLNDLLKSGNTWRWSKECTRAFDEAKKLLVTVPVLAHFDPSLPIKLAGDASAYGIGAVISHVFPDGQERPIAFSSRTLSKTEKNYGQIEKRGPLSDLWDPEIPPIFVWSQICFSDRPQASYYIVWSKEGNPISCCCSTTEMGSFVVSIFL